VTRPRPCAQCGINPIAYSGRAFCYDCVPRVWKRPPQCKRCGSQNDYYTAGRCRRCHRSAPLTGSCTDCLAWGVTRRRDWLCEGCHGWRKRFPVTADCPACGRCMTVNGRGYCRLCSRQAHLLREPHHKGDVIASNQTGQQLFIADLFRQKRDSAPAATSAATSWPLRYPVAHRQLALTDARRDLLAARRRGLAAPPLPDLALALDQATSDHADRHGWSRTLTDMTRRGIHILLTVQDTPGAPITFSEARLLNQLPMQSVQCVVEVLSDVGMLDDDRPPALQDWFTRHTTGLPDTMAGELQQWFLVMRDGSTTAPRSRPRQAASTRHAVAAVIPALQTWAHAGHQSLREITREDVCTVLPADTELRRKTVTGLRSMFKLLKARHVVFVNPTARVRAEPPAASIPLPADLSTVREALASSDPFRSALAAVIAYHAPRVRHLRELRTTDIHDGRMFIAGRAVLLAAPVRERLSAMLTERARRWPGTANPYLFINQYTAARACPVSTPWITATLGVPAKTIRDDRILHEAIATQGDVRQLCELFGIGVASALRYTHTTDQPQPNQASSSS
jgi:hypothetical protein